MIYSKKGLELTKSFEGCELTAYLDSGGVPSIGYGHTKGVKIGDTCTQEQADSWLLDDIQWAADVVNRLVKVPLTQCEFDSLTDFTYNVGSGNFSASTLLQLVNFGQFEAAAAQFQRWDKCKGVEVAGLLRRRIAEMNEFDPRN